MATMLAFVFTDAALSAPILKTMLRQETETSFNSITVDGDRSTNDCVLLFATGQANVPPIPDANDPRLADFRGALSKVLADLAIQIVRDGEGATKFITVAVAGGKDRVNSSSTVRRVIGRFPGDQAHFHEFPEMSHWLIGEPESKDVSDLTLQWLDARGIGPKPVKPKRKQLSLFGWGEAAGA
mgnify:CR=1 FL=1